MTKPIPTIQKHMTTQPHSIGFDQPMSAAHRMMREHAIRHLPVLSGGKIVGIVSDRDLNLIETLRDVDPKQVRVEDAMTSAPYITTPSTPLDEVVATMAEHKYGCAIIAEHEKLVGVFTTVDACRAFAEMLHGRLAK
ncbi:MAG: CBS domain-containing protein [Polyangiaceae bacterium]